LERIQAFFAFPPAWINIENDCKKRNQKNLPFRHEKRLHYPTSMMTMMIKMKKKKKWKEKALQTAIKERGKAFAVSSGYEIHKQASKQAGSI